MPRAKCTLSTVAETFAKSVTAVRSLVETGLGEYPLLRVREWSYRKDFEEILAPAAKRVISGDVVEARDILSKYPITSAASIAFALAETYDPNMLAAWSVSSISSDAPLARKLYRQSMEHEPLAAKARDRLAAQALVPCLGQRAGLQICCSLRALISRRSKRV
jgi:hypothetical protein